MFCLQLYEKDVRAIVQHMQGLNSDIETYIEEKKVARAKDKSKMENKLFEVIEELLKLEPMDDETRDKFVIPYIKEINSTITRSRAIIDAIESKSRSTDSGAARKGDDTGNLSEKNIREMFELVPSADGDMNADSSFVRQLNVLYGSTLRAGDLDLVAGWRTTFIMINNGGDDDPILVINLLYAINTMAKFAPAKWQHIYEWASALFVGDLTKQAQPATLSLDEFIQRLRVTPILCVKGLLCDITRVTKSFTKIEQESERHIALEEDVSRTTERLPNMIAAQTAMVQRTNEAIASARSVTLFHSGENPSAVWQARAASHDNGFPDVWLPTNVGVSLEKPSNKNHSKLEMNSVKFDQVKALIRDLKGDLQLRRMLMEASKNEARQRLKRAMGINHKAHEHLKNECKPFYVSASHEMEKKYKNSFHTFATKTQKMETDMRALSTSMEKVVEEELRPDHEEKMATLTAELNVYIEKSKDTTKLAAATKETVKELEHKLHLEYIAMKEGLENKKQLSEQRDIDRARLLECWSKSEVSEGNQFAFLDKLTRRPSNPDRDRLLYALWSNYEESLRTKYTPKMASWGNTSNKRRKSSIVGRRQSMY